MNRKTFYVDFDETNNKFGFSGIALTKTPANKEFFVALKELKLFLNEDKQMLYGPLLIPEQRILRHTKDLGYFDIIFSKEVIEKLASNLQLKTIPFNYEHNKGQKVEGILREVWLTGTPDKSNAYGYDLPEGSLFGGVHIQDIDFWKNEVKTGNVKGFSIEANMELLLTELKNINNMKIQLTEVTDIDGRILKTKAEAIEVGTVMYTEVDGQEVPLEAGEYHLGDGKILVVDEAGTVVEIKELSAEDRERRALEAEMASTLAPFLGPLEAKIKTLEAKLAEVTVELSNLPKAPKAPKKVLETKLSGANFLADYAARKKALTN